MARFMFTWELGQGLGHLVRYLPLVRALVGRGDEVWFLVKDAQQAAKVFAGLSINIEQIKPGSTPPERQLTTLNSYPEILHNFGFYAADELEKQVAAWIARFNKIRPDVLIIDHSPTAMLANRVSKIPSIATGTGFTVPPLRAPMRPLRYWQLREPAELLRSERKVLDISNAVLRRFDGRALDTLSDLISCDAAWLLSFPELDHYGIRDGAKYYGNFPVQEHGRAPRWKDHDVPKVFAYLTASHVPGEFASAIRDMSANLLLFAPNLVPGEEERFVASRTERSRFPLDLELVARQCDAAVTNGGLNTVSAFFRGGTPQLVLADNLECYMVGRRLEITGAGLLNFASSERALSLKLRAVLTDRSISRNASRFAIKYQSANSHTQLADMLADIAALAVSLS